MLGLHSLLRQLSKRSALLLLFIVVGLFVSGCSTKRQVTVPPLLTPLKNADTSQLIQEVNRLASVRSMRGKSYIQFLDTSFAECGVADKYRVADATLTLQRPGQVHVEISFFSVDIAEMTSDGERFRVAIYQGDEKYKRFVLGTNSANYKRLEANGDSTQDKCGKDKDGKNNATRAVSSLSSMRPQHFTDALLVPPIAPEGSNLNYALTETYEEEPDTRPNAKKGARIIRGYYLLLELAPESGNRSRVLRRFWFDRVNEIRLARLQTYDERGQIITDVVYKEPKNFGEEGTYKLPSIIELTRPQDGYSLLITYHTPEAVKVNQQYPNDFFVLQNKHQLPEVDLDARKE